MRLEVFDDADAVARAAAATIADDARAAIAARDRFAVAVSGGHTPWIMLRALASEDVPWAGVHLFQVDERVAPDGHPDRNLTHLRESLLQHAPLRPEQIHAMPVESPDLAAAAIEYARGLREIAGSPPVLDLVHLGLGPEGHTASLVPGDPVLEVTSADVALTRLWCWPIERLQDSWPLDTSKEDKNMRVGIATDHGGFGLKEDLAARLRAAGHEVVDFGAHELNEGDDYPDFVTLLARAVAAGTVERGVGVCGSGVGASVCANKIRGVRAALVEDHFCARQGVEDDHMNVICMGARTIGPLLAWDLVETFLAAKFSQAERHLRRLGKVAALELEPVGQLGTTSRKP